MGDIENKAGLILVGIVIFIFLMVVAFIKRNSQAKTDEMSSQESNDAEGKVKGSDQSGEYK